jgi:hypothetical protein
MTNSDIANIFRCSISIYNNFHIIDVFRQIY